MPDDAVARAGQLLDMPVKDLVQQFGMPSYTPDQDMTGRQWLEAHPEHRGSVMSNLSRAGITEDHITAAMQPKGATPMRVQDDTGGQPDQPPAQQPPPLGKTLQAGRVADSPAPGADTGNSLANGWSSWIDKPNNRAALMQFGIAMLQPMGMGETGIGRFANAVGAAGEAHQHVTSQAQQAEKASTEAELRQSTAAARETSANAAEMRALYSGENSRLRTEKDQASATARALTSQAAARSKYDKYISDVNKRNTDVLRPEGSPLETPMPYGEWIRSPDGKAALIGESAGAPGETGEGAPAPVAKTSWEAMTREPKVQAATAQIRQAVSSGDPQMIAKAKQYIQQHIAPNVDPSEMPKVFQHFGITR